MGCGIFLISSIFPLTLLLAKSASAYHVQIVQAPVQQPELIGNKSNRAGNYGIVPIMLSPESLSRAVSSTSVRIFATIMSSDDSVS
jgi:hypothetical protein